MTQKKQAKIIWSKDLLVLFYKTLLGTFSLNWRTNLKKKKIGYFFYYVIIRLVFGPKWPRKVKKRFIPDIKWVCWRKSYYWKYAGFFRDPQYLQVNCPMLLKKVNEIWIGRECVHNTCFLEKWRITSISLASWKTSTSILTWLYVNNI